MGAVMDAFCPAHATPTFSPNEEDAAEERARIDAGESIPGAETAGCRGMNALPPRKEPTS